ncbi:hypothetical protein MTR_1g043790 [Medicago truncatula]|uniref:Uncharacterized protein n=1 Tax=Medicago truncatula TaxID=3880 RepID=G7I5H5_MEDTR|nr:hypothetical protein MTR_1g043790 [Medicago truncatula]
MGSGVPIYPLPVPYPCFEIGENSNPIKMGKIRQIEFGSDGVKELKAFDEKKLGVKGLVGITKVPRIFYQPPDYNPFDEKSHQ